MKKACLRAAAALLLSGALAVPALAAPLLPQKMQPDTILTYDEELNPIVLQGGYLPEETYALELPTRTELPPDATAEEIQQCRLADEVAAIQYFDIMSGYAPEGYLHAAYYSVSSGTLAAVFYRPDGSVYPRMIVEYWHDGSIENVYYPDPASPNGYSLHGDEDIMRARPDIRTMSAALPIVQQSRAMLDWLRQMQG